MLSSDGRDGESDPYVYLVAYDRDGHTKQIRLKTEVDTTRPLWFEWVNFGYGQWEKFTVSIWDKDEEEEDEPLSDESVYYFPSYYTGEWNVRKEAYSGYITFRYLFTPYIV